MSYPFTTILAPMKPSKPKRDNETHAIKLSTIMESGEYAFEEKIDGISILCIGGRFFTIRISKKTGIPSEKTQHVPHLSFPMSQVMGKMIFDGELYYPYKKSNHVTSITNSDVAKAIERQQGAFLHGTGDSLKLPDFVENRRSEEFEPGYLRYVVYDILRDIDGTWLVSLPFKDRRKILVKRLQKMNDIPCLDLNKVHLDNFRDRLDRILSAGGEGAVLKSLNGFYYPGKRPMWNQVKLKQEMEDDVFITGFAPPNREYAGTDTANWPYWELDEQTQTKIPVTEHHHRGLIGSIKIAKYDDNGSIVDMGTVTGLTDALREDMSKNPDSYINRVITIKAMEISEHGVYRHANFVDFHPDKNPSECRVTEND